MFGDVFLFLINIAFSLLGIALIVRAWIFAIRLHPFNPYVQSILKLTDWMVHPLRKVLPTGNRADWASIVGAWLIAFLYLITTWVVFTGQLPAVQMLLPALVAAVFTALKWALNVVLWATLIQAILSWVNPLAPVMPVLQTLTAPLLNPLRRVMPNLGGIDLSPLALLLLAQVGIMILQQISFRLFGA
jgi:YggT family protein